MSLAFRTSDKGFYFPDKIFPAVLDPFPSLPLSPSERIARINNEYERVVSHYWNQYKQFGITAPDGGLPTPDSKAAKAVFKWARDALDFGEIQPGVDDNLLEIAKAIVISISTTPGTASKKCRGAADYLIGLWNMFGLFGVPVDRSKAMDLFLESAKLGYSRALYRLGNEYEHQNDVPVALAYFEHGVRRGDAACLYRMALAHLKGQLNKQVDPELGMKYLERSSLLSDPDCPQPAYIYGLVQLGELPSLNDLKGKSSDVLTAADHETAFKSIERSAWLGFPPAMLRMSKAWQDNGKGFDASVALRYFHLLSRQEQYRRFKDPKGDQSEPILEAVPNGTPEVEIAKWLLCGSQDCNLDPNEEWAFKFSSLAAELNNPTGQFAVGYCFEVGIYVASDLSEAKKWYQKSAQAGSKDAVERLNALAIASMNVESTEAPYPAGTVQASNKNFVSVSRQLTRKDHENSLTLRGKGSIKSTREIPRTSVPASPAIPEDQRSTYETNYMSSPESSPTRSTSPPKARKDLNTSGTLDSTNSPSDSSTSLYQKGDVPDLSPNVRSKVQQQLTTPLAVSRSPSPVNRGRPESRGKHRASYSVTLQDSPASALKKGMRQVSTPTSTLQSRPISSSLTSSSASGALSQAIYEHEEEDKASLCRSAHSSSPTRSSTGSSTTVSPKMHASSVPYSDLGTSTPPLVVKKNSQASLAQPSLVSASTSASLSGSNTASASSSPSNSTPVSPESSPSRGSRRTSASDLAKQVISVFNKNRNKDHVKNSEGTESARHSLMTHASRISLTPSVASIDSASSGISSMSLSSSSSGTSNGTSNGLRSTSPLRKGLSTIPEPSEETKSEQTIRSVSAAVPSPSATTKTLTHKFSKASSMSLSNIDLPLPSSRQSVRSIEKSPGSSENESVFSRRSTLSSASSTTTQSIRGTAGVTTGQEQSVPDKRNEYALTFEEMNIPLTIEEKEDCIIM